MSCASPKASCARVLPSSCVAARSTARINYRRPAGSAGALEIDSAALERLLAAVHLVARTMPQAATVNALDVLRWPGVVRDESAVGDELLAAAYAVFGATLDELVAARAREGARLRELLEQRCTGLETLVADVRARLPEVQARVRARLDERLAELAARSIRSVSSRSSRSCCSGSTWMRSSSASAATSTRCAA